MKTWHEDDVINAVASFLRQLGWQVLAAGGNQAALFWFHITNGRRKAPDLVAVKGEILLVCEAKITAAALVRNSINGDSDLEIIKYLVSSEVPQQEMVSVTEKVLLGLNGDVGPLRIRGGLIASTSFEKYEQLTLEQSLILIRVVREDESVYIYQDPFNVF